MATHLQLLNESADAGTFFVQYIQFLFGTCLTVLNLFFNPPVAIRPKHRNDNRQVLQQPPTAGFDDHDSVFLLHHNGLF